MFEEGIFATSVVYPTVALDKARLRTIVSSEHTTEELQTALAAHDAALAALPELQARIDRCISVYVQDAKSAAKVSEFRSRVDRTAIVAHVTALFPAIQ